MTCEEKVCEQVVINMKCGCGAGEATADITIGENGNWFINGEDIGVQAQGPVGEKGDPGEQGPQGIPGSTGSFANMEKLFDGRADKMKQAYGLSKTITEYPLLLVEMRVRLTDNPDSEFARHHDVVPFSEISQEGKISYTRILTTTGGAISWYFDSEASFVIRLIKTPDFGVDEIYISKVYGIM